MREPLTRACRQCGKVFSPDPSAVRRGAGHFCGRTCYHQSQSVALKDRFWQKVEKTETCWLWTGGRTVRGYGQLGAGGFRATKLLAHRISYELHYGEIGEDLEVLHRCDVPLCVNPEHLFLGTQCDNMRDMAQKARSQIGERHHNSQLTEPQVLEIRARYQRGTVTYKQLAAEYGVSQMTICGIVKRRYWKHI